MQAYERKEFYYRKKGSITKKARLEQPFPHNIFEGAQSSS
jgi:hypothetical protein